MSDSLKYIKNSEMEGGALIGKQSNTKFRGTT